MDHQFGVFTAAPQIIRKKTVISPSTGDTHAPAISRCLALNGASAADNPVISKSSGIVVCGVVPSGKFSHA